MLITPAIKYAIVAPTIAPKVPNPKITRIIINPVLRVDKTIEVML